MRNPASSTVAAEAGGTKTPCCVKVGLKRGPWTPEEDELLANFINREGEGKWRTLPKRAGLLRCGKSCRLRWMNYLRPSVKRGHITPDEEDLILRLHRLLGNRWSLIAGRIPGRTDNEIKNYWNTHLSKKLISQGIDPRTHKPLSDNSHNSALPLNPNLMLPSNYNSEESNNSGAAFGADPPMAEPEFCFDSTRNSTFHPNLNVNHHNFEDQEDDPNCNDEVFSTFLNSLINEDIFTQPTQSISAFGAPVWEAPPLISTTDDATFHNSHVHPLDDPPQ